jgi:glycosyltransferase involved in cell wall biosynthesis
VKLAILTTHPIQYHVGWFRALAKRSGVDLKVLYCHEATPKEQADAGFGVEFQWDVSLFDGYAYRFLNNVARDRRVSGFQGLDTPEIKEIIARERYDAVMVNGWHYKSAWQTIWACWQTRTPVMLRSDSHLNTERSTAKRAVKWPLYRWFIPRLDGCLAAGQWSSDYFLHYGASRDRVFIVPHVVDTAYFRRQAEELRVQRGVLRTQWGLDEPTTVFLFAGKFTKVKRPLDFVRAVGDAARAGSPVAGLMAGDGPERVDCEAFVRSNNIPVTFTGFLNQSEIVRAYVAADVLVLPSESETWGLVANEAMACGVPCFVTDSVGCGPDLIVERETGYIFRKGDTAALTSLMISSAKDEDLLKLMSKKVKLKAETFSVAKGVEAIMRAAESVTHRRLAS